MMDRLGIPDRLSEFRRVCSVAWSVDGTVIAAGDNYGSVACYTLNDRSFTSSKNRLLRFGVDTDTSVASLCPFERASSEECAFVTGTLDGTLAVLTTPKSPSGSVESKVVARARVDRPISHICMAGPDDLSVVVACGTCLEQSTGI